MRNPEQLIFLAREQLYLLFKVLQQAGYQCVIPQVRDHTIVFDTAPSDAHAAVQSLPRGYRDIQAPGRYQLQSSDNPRYFAWATGAQALKPLTFAPRETLWTVSRDNSGKLSFVETLPNPKPTAVIGVRGCDLAALQLQDQHFCYKEYADNYYNRRRRSLLLIGVDCAFCAETCFCHSTGDGVNVTTGYDIAMSELDDGFILRYKSDKGRALLAELPQTPVTEAQLQHAEQQTQAAIAMQTRRLPSRNLHDTLFSRLSHPHWAEVAKRCLSCTSCTSVCPTCFCHSEGDQSEISGHNSEHYRQWDSCFTSGHSYMHSFVLRDSTELRYRQWMTHKLGSWHEQYGRSGCVGCGRCITWCPVGIDFTAEVAAICETKE